MNQIHPTALIGDNVVMGEGNVIGPYAVIGWPGAIRGDHTFKGRVSIGDNNTIGCHVTIAAGTEGTTVIGDRNIIMNHANIGHNTVVGSDIEIGAGTIVCGWATIADRARLKAHCTVRNRKKVGPGATVGMGANVVKDIEGEQVVVGNPAKCLSLPHVQDQE